MLIWGLEVLGPGGWRLVGTMVADRSWKGPREELARFCPWLRSLRILGDPVVRGIIWDNGRRIEEEPLRLSTALGYCRQYGV